MTPEQMQQIRTFYESLRGQRKVLEVFSEKFRVIGESEMRVLISELDQINREFPDLLPRFRLTDHLSHSGSGRSLYHVTGILAYLEAALARLEVLLDTAGSTPVTESREFKFITDGKLRAILERDYAEIQRSYIAECWKSVIIVSGSAIEAILLDRLQAEAAKARASSKAPKEQDLTRWNLAQLIVVAVDVWPKLAGVEKLSHSVREYRNLVHPGNQIRTGLTFGKEEARIALEVLNLVQRELS